jgi:hypothetical protein
MSEQREKRAAQAWFSGPEFARINRFRTEQDDDEILTVAEALRRLVTLGLAAAESDEKRERAA